MSSTVSHAKPRSKKMPSSFLLTLFFIMFDLAYANFNYPSQSQFSKFSRQSVEGVLKKSSDNKEAFDKSIRISIDEAQSARALAFNFTLSSHKSRDGQFVSGVNDCVELLDDTLDQLSIITNLDIDHNDNDDDDDIQTRLSAALTNQETCMESLKENSKNYKFQVEKVLMESMTRNFSNSISNSLAQYMSTKPKRVRSSGGGNRRLLSEKKFPTWVAASERKLLEASIREIGVSAVVSKDGKGTHKTIGEAIKGSEAAASSSGVGGRKVIYIKAGTYIEYIKIPTKEKNVMLVGDGKGKTVIVGDRNFEEGWTTFQSATVAAMGDGFIARDITFVNSAGPSKHQAVALRVGSDKSVIFRCSILGYQDTLYAHSKGQFYRETDIYGTIDFIFGNAAAVLQNCNIYPRKPLSTSNHNFITAQGRTSPNQNTGISIHNCKIVAASDLGPVKSKYTTFLGRPWKQYSRTVIMQSYIDNSIHPSGWSPWSGDFGLKTLFYGEYMNSGPGASTSGRVKWRSYHASLTSKEANTYTVGEFISGNLWLPSTGVSFDSGLLG